MEIFGVGPFELVLIALVAFIVLGPERIPGAMRWLGRLVRQVRQMSQQLTKDYGEDIRQVTGELTAVQAELRNIQRDLTEVTRGLVTGTEKIYPPKTAAANPIDPPAPAAPAVTTDDSPVSSEPSAVTTNELPAADGPEIIDYRAGSRPS